jgi:hypothetical protein
MTLADVRHEFKTVQAVVLGAGVPWLIWLFTPFLKTPPREDDFHLRCTRLVQFQLSHV